jgi:hypothetical protein
MGSLLTDRQILFQAISISSPHLIGKARDGRPATKTRRLVICIPKQMPAECAAQQAGGI